MSTPTPAALDPKRTALLAMDFQPGILAHIPESDALVERVRGAIADVRDAGGTIGYVRVAFTEADWQAVSEHNPTFSGVAAARMWHHEEPATQVAEPLAPEVGDIVVRKVRYGAISTTDLAEQLAERGVDTVVLAGVSTSGVVLSTLIDAADRDLRVLVLADGVADPSPEVHDTLLRQVFPSRAQVIDSAALRELLGST